MRYLFRPFVRLRESFVVWRGLVAGDYEYKRGDYDAAMREWLPLAKRGHATAQYNIGRMYDFGRGVPKNDRVAAEWYRKAADQGVALAQYNLGTMYAKGDGVSKDYAEAVKWYRKAAEQGVAEAQSMLGGHYFVGKGVSKDDDEAMKWYGKAANPNYSSGLAALPSASGIGRVYGGDLIWILCRRLGLIFWVEGRLLPRRLRALCPDTGGEQDEHFLVWTGRWECDADPCLQLFDTDSDLQECAAYGFECCAAPSRAFRCGAAQPQK